METVLLGSANAINQYGYLKSPGLFRVATEIRRSGYTCQCIDGFPGMLPEEFEDVIIRYVTPETRLVGISTTLLSSWAVMADNRNESKFWGVTTEQMREWVFRIKELAPHAIVVAGGSQTFKENAPELSRYSDFIDYYISGQGEGPIRALLAYAFTGAPLRAEVHEGAAFVTQEAYPDHHFERTETIWVPEDHIEFGEALSVEVARGCIFKCSYCSYDLLGKSWGDLLKDPGVLRRELIRNYEMWGTDCYLIPDDTFNDSLEKLRHLHRLFLELPFQIEFATYTRLDLFVRHPEMADLLKEMGLRATNLGVETLHAKAGRAIGKGLGEKRVKEGIDILHKSWGNEVFSRANFILGLPFEDEGSMERTIEWATGENYGLHGAEFYDLRVDSQAPKSRIEQEEIEKYGYSFSSRFEWFRKIDGMSSARAVALRKEATRKVYESRPWLGGLTSLGYPALKNTGFGWDHIGKILREKNNKITVGGETQVLPYWVASRTYERNRRYLYRLLEAPLVETRLLPYGEEPIRLL